ncbi:unnamed protein product [Arabidopsis halleri]
MGNKEDAKIDGVSDEVDKLSNKVNLSLYQLSNILCFSFPPKTSTIPTQQWELFD